MQGSAERRYAFSIVVAGILVVGSVDCGLLECGEVDSARKMGLGYAGCWQPRIIHHSDIGS